MPGRTEHCGNCEAQVAALHQVIQIDRLGNWKPGTPDGDWVILGDDIEPYKIKAYSNKLGLFIKSYSPRTLDYASHTFAALRELSELRFRTPVLPPLALCGDTLVFSVGEVIRRAIYEQVFDDVERTIVRMIADNHGLETLWNYMKVDVVLVDGQEYIVDPLADDESTIFDYIKAKK